MIEALKEKLVGYNEVTGFEITEWREGFAEFMLHIDERHMNRTGSVHGGVYATIIDAAMGFSTVFTGDPVNRNFVVTLSMTLNYLRTVRGGVIRAQATQTGGGKSIAFSEGKIIDEAGNVLVSSSGTFKRVNYKP